MDIEMEVARLMEDYPNSEIVYLSGQIACMLPRPTHLHQSVTVSVVDGRTESHIHRVATEFYKLLEGELTLYHEGSKAPLILQKAMLIRPGEEHYVEGRGRLEITSTPAWAPDDHIYPFRDSTFEEREKLLERLLDRVEKIPEVVSDEHKRAIDIRRQEYAIRRGWVTLSLEELLRLLDS